MKKYEDPLARSIQTRELVKRLRRDIILNKYAKGSRLIEAKIAEQLGISRAPVRASLQLLAQEGLVINLSNGGTEVVGLTESNTEDLFDLRLLLEKKALETILSSGSFHYKPLFDFMESFETFYSSSNGIEPSSSDTSQLDIQFHRSLILMSENHPLLTAWNTMANIFQAILEINIMTYGSFQEFYENHKHLAELVIQKKPECIEALTTHITNAKKVILARMEPFHKK